jgi:hypothetical protein
MDNFEKLENKIFAAEVFDSLGEFKPEYAGFWKARLADHRLAEAMRKHCAPALLARSVAEIATAFEDLPDFIGKMQLEKAASDWTRTVPVRVPAATLFAAYMGDWQATMNADAYAMGHDAYGRAHAAERVKADNLTDAFSTMSVVIGDGSGNGPDGPIDE